MKKTNLKLQTLFIVLSIMAILSSVIGGYLYYSTLKNSSEEWTHKEAIEQLRDLGNDIDAYLAWALLSVESLAGLKELSQSLLRKDVKVFAEVNSILDHFNNVLNVSVCYLMDDKGNTVASSNRDTPDSFVGKNYGFRPYFTKAIHGNPTVYMALGVTSGKRGIYYSHPVYSSGREKPIGVVVIKASIELIEKDFMNLRAAGAAVLVDPYGIVFISSRDEWLYQSLWETSLKETSDIAKTKQFGKGPWNWTGMKQKDKNIAVDTLGNEYRIHIQKLVNYPGWDLIYLHSDYRVLEEIIVPIRRSIGVGVVTLCIIFGSIVFFLYVKANASIVQRKKAEQALEFEKNKLQDALSKVKELSGMFPICASCKKIRDDKGYWNQIESYIRDHSEAEFSHGICPDCAKKLYPDIDVY